jgi:hypothetical protein
MAIQELTAFLSAGKAALDLFKGIREELPQDDRSKKLREQIDKAEEAFKKSEAELAKKLGYRLCRCTFPPQIMLWDKEQRRSVCQRCGDLHPPNQPEVQRTGGSFNAARRRR